MSQATYRMNRESNNREDRERNPFQRNNRTPRNYNNNNRRSDGSGGYQSWKHRQDTQKQAPKEKVLGPEDFPSLPMIGAGKPKATWVKPEVTLAERMKEIEENRVVIQDAPKEEDKCNITVIPLSNWIRNRHQAKKEAYERKQREIEEDEENYRWQVSKAMFPPEPEVEMPEFDEELDDEGNCVENYDYEVVEEPMYEERR